MKSGGRVVTVLETGHCIRLWAFLPVDDVELDFVTFFERFVPLRLNRRVMYEYIWPVFPSNESKAFGVVKPLDLSFVLSHTLLPSLHLGWYANGQDARTLSFLMRFIEVRYSSELLSINERGKGSKQDRLDSSLRTLIVERGESCDFGKLVFVVSSTGMARSSRYARSAMQRLLQQDTKLNSLPMKLPMFANCTLT